MTTLDLLRLRREEILRTAARHGVSSIRIFGSTAQAADEPGSDVDLLVEVTGTTTPWFPSGLVLDLEELLGRPVDVVTEKGLNPLLKDRVMRQAVPL